MTTMRFVLQSDPGVSLMERRAVDHACMLRDDMRIAGRQSIEDLARIPFGAIHEQRSACPVGTVEFCRAWMRAAGVPEPEPVDYPAALQDALQRQVVLAPFSDVAFGAWVKPVRTKAWTPHVKRSAAAHAPDERVWTSAVIPETDWLAEWRIYVASGVHIGSGRYDDGPREDVHFDTALVQSWIDRFEASGQALAGYALDVALWPNGQTVLVEVTDGWAIGYYRGDCSPAHYATLLAERWREIAGRSVARAKDSGHGGGMA